MIERSGALRDWLRCPAVCAPFSDDALIAAMLRFEAALAHAQAGCGLIPAATAHTIADVCAGLRPDPGALARSARRASTLAIPLVNGLTEAVAARDPQAAGFEVADELGVLVIGQRQIRLPAQGWHGDDRLTEIGWSDGGGFHRSP